MKPAHYTPPLTEALKSHFKQKGFNVASVSREGSRGVKVVIGRKGQYRTLRASVPDAFDGGREAIDAALYDTLAMSDKVQASYALIVGRVLALQRALLGKNQSELADAAGVVQSAWSKIERGRTVASCEQLHRVATLLCTSPGGLLVVADSVVCAMEADGHAIDGTPPSAEVQALVDTYVGERLTPTITIGEP